MCEAGPEARAGFMEDRIGAHGILALMPAHWCVQLGPRLSGGQGCPGAAVGS